MSTLWSSLHQPAPDPIRSRRELHRTDRPRDHDTAVLERLAGAFDGVAAEHGEFVEERHAVMREGLGYVPRGPLRRPLASALGGDEEEARGTEMEGLERFRIEALDAFESSQQQEVL